MSRNQQTKKINGWLFFVVGIIILRLLISGTILSLFNYIVLFFLSLFISFLYWSSITNEGKKFFQEFNLFQTESKNFIYDLEDLGNSFLSNRAYDDIMYEYSNVSSCSQGRSLNISARNEINRLNNHINVLNQEISKYDNIIYKHESKWQGWEGFNKIVRNIIILCMCLTNFYPMSKVQLENLCYQKYIYILKSYIDDLERNIYLIPESYSQKQNLIKQLKLEKKELQMQKREQAVIIKEIRRSARQSNAKLAYKSGKFARYLRHRYTVEKEQQLYNPENIIAMLDSEILAIDKHLLFLEKLSN